MDKHEPDLTQEQKVKVARGCTYGGGASLLIWILAMAYLYYA